MLSLHHSMNLVKGVSIEIFSTQPRSLRFDLVSLRLIYSIKGRDHLRAKRHSQELCQNLAGGILDRSLVVITGASSGIGAAFARRLASEHDLLLIARRGDRLSELASQLKARHGCNVETLAADLTVSDDLARVAERISHDPRLVLLINNAGYGNKGSFWETDFETQDR